MASDLLVGFFVGVVLFGFASPAKGMIWMIWEYKKQVKFLTGQKPLKPDEYPNRKERT